jgi:hypothetical protein
MASILEENNTSKLFLNAVNKLLRSINEPPIDTEEDINSLEEASIAATTLIETKREVLTEGWKFNRDDNYSFPPNDEGIIVIPANVLDISSSDGNLIMRDWRLYSISGQTAIFDEPQPLNVIWDMGFNSLTHPIRNYITIRATRIFQAEQVMDTSLYAYNQNDEEQAYMLARRSEGRTGNFNMLNSTFGQNYRVRS